MKEINNVNFVSLKAGTKFVEIINGEVRYFDFLMIHPHNDKYILAINDLDENADKIYIPRLVDGGYFMDYTIEEVNLKKIDQLKARIQYIEKRIEKSKNYE